MTYAPKLNPVAPPPLSLTKDGDWRDFVKRYMHDQSHFRDALRLWTINTKESLEALDADIDTLTAALAALPSFPLSIPNGGTGQTTAITAFDALNPTSAKGDLVAHDGTTSTRLAVGTNYYPLIADSAATNGFKWATTQPTLVVHQIPLYARPLFNATATADPAVPTLAATDTTLDTAGSATGHRAGKNFVNSSITWLGWSFVVPEDLDTTQAIDVKISAVLLADAAGDDVAEWTCHYRATAAREAYASAGASGSVNGTGVLTSHVNGDMAQFTITAAIPANTLTAYDTVHGVIERDARSTNADDTYANTLVVVGVMFQGKRKLWS